MGWVLQWEGRGYGWGWGGGSCEEGQGASEGQCRCATKDGAVKCHLHNCCANMVAYCIPYIQFDSATEEKNMLASANIQDTFCV